MSDADSPAPPSRPQQVPLEVAGKSDIGRRRSVNEDTLGDRAAHYATRFPDRGYLYAVADGMGGYNRGEVASSLAIEALFDAYYRTPADQPAEAALYEAIQTANRTVFAK